MPKGRYKKPSLKKFQEAVEASQGWRGKVAEYLGVNRYTVNMWCKEDPEFAACFTESKGKFLDDCLKSARMLATGIPLTKKVNGKNVVVGWKERPDAGMLRYLIGRLGKDEGFGESIDITSNGETIQGGTTQIAPMVIEVIDKREDVRKDETIIDVQTGAQAGE